MNRDQSAAAMYSTILTVLLNKFSLSLLGEELTNEATGGANRGAPSYLRNLKSLVLHAIENDEMTLLPEGQTWSSVLEDALSEATLPKRILSCRVADPLYFSSEKNSIDPLILSGILSENF